ncbi:MAG: PD-(D/E)XK motif protein, partial [Alphaproteobacteria bacterium]|nr:PD-(D/E)XK motif protein [Alphaproteobacteria bacterium]
MTNPWSIIAKPTSELNVRLVSDQHPLALFWGVDVRGCYLFVVETATDAMPDRRSLPELAGIRLASTAADGRSRLMLLLNENQNWELFLALCNDLVRASAAGSGEAAAMAILIRRLQRWHEFLRRQRSPILPLEGIKGLIGELLFLADTLAPRF